MPIEAADLETIINVLGEDRYSLEIIERGQIVACGMSGHSVSHASLIGGELLRQLMDQPDSATD